MRKILEKISKWESRDKKSHDDYLIYLADVFELFASGFVERTLDYGSILFVVVVCCC